MGQLGSFICCCVKVDLSHRRKMVICGNHAYAWAYVAGKPEFDLKADLLCLLFTVVHIELVSEEHKQN